MKTTSPFTSLKRKICLFFILPLSLTLGMGSAFASQFECRRNTDEIDFFIYRGKMPVIRIYGFDGIYWIKLRTLRFKNYDERKSALQSCDQYKNRISVSHGTFNAGFGVFKREVSGYAIFENGALVTEQANELESDLTKQLRVAAELLETRILDSIQ